MSHIFFSDPTIFSRLQEFDAALAQETLDKGCPFCGGVLHRADYPRKPRGIPEDHRQAFSFRFSFCCAKCRRRSTSESLRFLGRKVYVGLVVVLASCCRGRIHAWFSRVSAHTGVSLRTLYCWRSFWRKTFPSTSFWREARGRFMPLPDSEAFPLSLHQSFEGSGTEQTVACLRFLRPITIGPIIMIGEG
ncbi:MAG: hypothetical protein GJU73_10690 [Ferrovum sp.]|uniref:hypothetical protein n=1 Tax=Ferrovum sp. TaxID=2609467 RepID=UPI002633632C|nr:hypothetical protein [Ferrovum sp.]MBW8067892.1 hypothetical protein [Ferrovum sp.]MBW9250079.1 hypothetical protein [Acidithiobacillus ferriphilus]